MYKRQTLASTIIDITLSDKLAVSVNDWTVVKGENFTDHNDITFKLETEKIILEKTRKWENAEWSIFTDTLANQQLQVRNVLNEKRLDTMVSKTYSALNRALDLACYRCERTFLTLPRGRLFLKTQLIAIGKRELKLDDRLV